MTDNQTPKPIQPAYRDKSKIIFRCEDLFYPEYKGQFFVLSVSDGYGYFEEMIETYTKGKILDEFNVIIK